MSDDSTADRDHDRFTGACPLEECSETFVGVSVSTLRRHVIDAHGFLAVLDLPGLSLIPDEPPSSGRQSD
ncbi:hypothetical protein [Haloprofundus salilacus]|uniref:hypothetical protein n=1 Tax=Haloprofundus salilacus TaxID=2876190 RepID=UPI001CCF631F|nr:hypothetical protein [Haloprofundus salilacus]